MIPPLAFRLAAAAVALATPLDSVPSQAQTTAAPTVLPHISITTMGRDDGRGGRPVVMIPGLSSPRAVWDGVAPRLAAGRRVLLVQVNGFGGDAPGDNLKPGLLAGAVADLHGYLATRKLGKVDVIGHSMGGLLALMLAEAHPADVGRLMAVDALPFVGLLFSPAATAAMVEPQARAIRDGMAAAYGRPADPTVAQATADRLALKPDSRAKVKDWALASDPRVTAVALYEDMTTDVRPGLPAIAAPITVLYPVAADGHDQPMAAATYKGAYTGTRDVAFVAVPDSAHFVMLDQPAAFAAAVNAFLAK